MSDSKLNRRNFIKMAGIVTGGALLSNSLPSAQAQTNHVTEKLPAIDKLLAGVSDIHVHAAPDTKDRSINELAFAKQAKEVGYRSIMYKSNDWSCHDRAYLIRQALPDFECFGSLCMNRAHGDKVNVYAAQMAVKTTGHFCRCIWMPTLDSQYQHTYYKTKQKGIPVLSNTGEVLPEVVSVMEICAEADIIFATGHCSPKESIVLAKKAREVGVNKFVVTHANSLIWKMTHEQIKEVIDLGGYIEYCYLTNLWGKGTGLPDFERMTDEEFVAFTKISPERSFITTDLGQVNMPNPIEGMRACIKALLKADIPQPHIDLMVRSNPALLMGLNG